MSRERVETIDYLRGILSVSIMFYHYMGWLFPNQMAEDSLLSKVGYYGVSAFFVISGMSMCIAYNGRLSTPGDVNQYVIRRVLRIVPLYMLASVAALAAAGMASKTQGAIDVYGWSSVVLNFTLLFSFIDPSKAIPGGGWSIGNELFFYCYFPIMLYLIRLHRAYAAAILLVSAGMFIYWAMVLVPSAGEAQAWKEYVSNQNQALFFVCGVLIAYAGARHKMGNLASITLGVLAFMAFWAVSVEVSTALVVGWERLALGICTIAFVASVYFVKVKLPSAIAWVLHTVGALSFSIYLLHPLVFSVVRKVGSILGLAPELIIAASVAGTLVGAYVVYHWFELPIMRLGKKPKPQAPINAEMVKG